VPAGIVISRHPEVAVTGSGARAVSARSAVGAAAGAVPAGVDADTSALPGIAVSERLQPPATTLATSTLKSVIRIPASSWQSCKVAANG
jgi:hypothetical protein